MEQRIKIAGTGGQGVMVTGKILGYAASDHDKFASFLPQYGTQMRGGTASCTLIVSDEEIGSPIVSIADLMMMFQQEALDKNIDKLKPGGLLFINSNTCGMPKRRDIEVVALPVDDPCERNRVKTSSKHNNVRGIYGKDRNVHYG